jgi:hypothetical protein
VEQDIDGATTKISWGDLTDTEKIALKRMNRGPYAGLSKELGARLVELGLAVARPAGVGISRFGRRLVIDMLLDAGKKNPDRS